MAQWKRAGLITLRSLGRNKLVLLFFSSYFLCRRTVFHLKDSFPSIMIPRQFFTSKMPMSKYAIHQGQPWGKLPEFNAFLLHAARKADYYPTL
jgi:hypothetical protein